VREHKHSGYYVPGFIRGCYDNMLQPRGFNQTIVKWYRWLQRDSCHSYSRKAVLQVRHSHTHILSTCILQLPNTMPDGEISLCTCYSDGCNGSPKLSGASPFVAPVLRYITQVFHCTICKFCNNVCRFYSPAIL
jgi:hypothetical protein